MNTYMPSLLAAGQFDSKVKFQNIKQSPLRIATEYEIEYYFENGGYSYLNGKKYPMQKGNILVIHPGDERSSTLPFRCFYIHFTNVSPQIKGILDTLPSFMKAEVPAVTEAFFARISAYFLSAESSDSLAAMGELFLLIKYLHKLMLKSYHDSASKEFNNVLEQAQKFIDLCYTQELTVDLLAHKCNVSSSYLYRLFSEKLGTSPHTAILNRKLTAARSMLMNTELSINDVAANCGFNSPAYFSDCFKKQNNGLTPSAFRKQADYRP